MSLPKNTCVPYNRNYRNVARKPVVVHEHVPDFIVEKTNHVYASLNPSAPTQDYEIVNQEVKNPTEIKELTSLMLQFMEDWGVDTEGWDSAPCIVKCKSAAYHNDPVRTDVAFVNWYVQGPTAFLHTDQHIEEIRPGDIMVFDPYCPHALTLHSTQLDSHRSNSSENATFIALEVPIHSVLHLLGIKKVNHPVHIMSSDDSINPQTGEWTSIKNSAAPNENVDTLSPSH
jgi:hypothetical protein